MKTTTKTFIVAAAIVSLSAVTGCATGDRDERRQAEEMEEKQQEGFHRPDEPYETESEAERRRRERQQQAGEEQEMDESPVQTAPMDDGE